jgi:hypothetical protein
MDTIRQHAPAVCRCIDPTQPEPEKSRSCERPKPEWLRVAEAVRIYGIGRSSLYVLVAEGKIRSAVIRRRNALRGTRLINCDSLAAFIESHATQI